MEGTDPIKKTRPMRYVPDLDAPLPARSRTFVKTAEEAARVAARMTREYEAENPEEDASSEPTTEETRP